MSNRFYYLSLLPSLLFTHSFPRAPRSLKIEHCSLIIPRFCIIANCQLTPPHSSLIILPCSIFSASLFPPSRLSGISVAISAICAPYNQPSAANCHPSSLFLSVPPCPRGSKSNALRLALPFKDQGYKPAARS